ncbi:MAG: twin-arginine translocase TatA/TatE family subunit [Acidiferrobacterales bacterium]
MGGIGIWQLVIILVIVILVFGAKKIRTLGGDLGMAIKNFKSAVKEGDEAEEEEAKQVEHKSEKVVDSDVTSKKKQKA